MRKTLYGTLTNDDELNENEKAMLYIKECAELVGIEVIEGETQFTIQFMAEIMRRLRNIKGTPLTEFGTYIDKAYKNFCNLESGDSYIIINGERHIIDVGYALEGVKLFVDYLKNMYEKNERNI